MTTFDLARLERIGAAFDADVAAGKIPGAVVLLWRDGRLCYERASGYRDRDAGAPMQLDTIFRGASMTKPLVSVAALQLVEEGKLQLWEPVAAYLPELATLTVGVEASGTDGKPTLNHVPCTRPMTVQDLMRHTSGFTYPPFGATLVHVAMREAGVMDGRQTNAEMITKLARLPLMYQPGSTFEYGMSTDVLGRIVEVIDGRELDASLAARIFEPLGMHDTGFALSPHKRQRFAEGLGGTALVSLKALFDPDAPGRWYSGGGGILTTAADYLRFAVALANRGENDGVRILSRKTVELMTSNHLPPACAYGTWTRSLGITAPLPEFGQGFGLGVNVRLEAGRNPNPGSIGDFSWSGVSGTYFWVDPAERLIAILMLQSPELRVHYRALLRDLTYGALF